MLTFILSSQFFPYLILLIMYILQVYLFNTVCSFNQRYDFSFLHKQYDRKFRTINIQISATVIAFFSKEIYPFSFRQIYIPSLCIIFKKRGNQNLASKEIFIFYIPSHSIIWIFKKYCS